MGLRLRPPLGELSKKTYPDTTSRRLRRLAIWHFRLYFLTHLHLRSSKKKKFAPMHNAGYSCWCVASRAAALQIQARPVFHPRYWRHAQMRLRCQATDWIVRSWVHWDDYKQASKRPRKCEAAPNKMTAKNLCILLRDLSEMRSTMAFSVKSTSVFA